MSWRKVVRNLAMRQHLAELDVKLLNAQQELDAVAAELFYLRRQAERDKPSSPSGPSGEVRQGANHTVRLPGVSARIP